MTNEVLKLVTIVSVVVVVSFLLFGGNWVVTDLESNEHIQSVEVVSQPGMDFNIVIVELTEPNPDISQVHIGKNGETLGMTTYPVGSGTVEFEAEDVVPGSEYQIRLVNRSGQIMVTVDFRLIEEHPWL